MTDYVGIIIQGFLNGIGNGLSAYFLARYLIRKRDAEKEEKEKKKIL